MVWVDHQGHSPLAVHSDVAVTGQGGASMILVMAASYLVFYHATGAM